MLTSVRINGKNCYANWMKKLFFSFFFFGGGGGGAMWTAARQEERVLKMGRVCTHYRF